jgi:hypothetical protein
MNENIPVLYQHCCEVYAAMEAASQPGEDGQQRWTGALTKLLNKIGLSNPYYSAVTQSLKAMDCIRQERRGGGGTPSIWLLMQPPSETLWHEFGAPSEGAKSQKVKQDDQRFRIMEERLTTLEETMKMVVDLVRATMDKEKKNG